MKTQDMWTPGQVHGHERSLRLYASVICRGDWVSKLVRVSVQISDYFILIVN